MSFTGIVEAGTVTPRVGNLPGETLRTDTDSHNVLIRRDTTPDESRGVFYVVVTSDAGALVVDRSTFNNDNPNMMNAAVADGYARGVAHTYDGELATREAADIAPRLTLIGEVAAETDTTPEPHPETGESMEPVSVGEWDGPPESAESNGE